MDSTSLIYKVLSGSASKSERKRLEDWIALTDANKSEFHGIKLLYESANSMEEQGSDNDHEEGFQTIKRLIHTRTQRRKRYTVAAGLLSIIVLLISVQIVIRLSRAERENIHLKFEEATLEHVINTLQDHYPVTIKVEKDLKHCKVTGTFYQKTVADIVRSISNCLSVRFTATGINTFKIEGTCNQ